MNRAMFFNFSSYAGLDVLLSILPKRWQTKTVARAWIKMLTTKEGVAPDPKKTPLILQMPWGSFRLLDLDGNSEPCAREHFTI